MEQKRPNTVRFPDLSGSGIWARLRRLLGSRESRREVDETVSNGNGSGNGAGNPAGEAPAAVKERSFEVEKIFNEQVVDTWDDSKNEAGRPEGRGVPALILGAQRYPKDPSVWGPDDVDGPLMQDEKYRETIKFLSELEDARRSASGR